MKKLLLLLLFIPLLSFAQTQSDYLDKGDAKSDSGDYYGAIYEYTKAIELGDFYPPALVNRALAKAKIGDLSSAFEDINYVIKIVPEFGKPYYFRGLLKSNYSKDYYGAISDYTKAIELNPDDANSYLQRGISKSILGDANGSCADWRKAVSFGNSTASQKLKDQCN